MAEPNPFANFISGQLNPGLVPRSSFPTGRSTIVSDDPLALYRKTMATVVSPNIFDGVTVFRGIVLYTINIDKELYSLSMLSTNFIGNKLRDQIRLFSCMIPELHAHLPNPYTVGPTNPEEFVAKLQLFPIFEPMSTEDDALYETLLTGESGAIVEIQYSDPNRTHGYISRIISKPDGAIVPQISISSSGTYHGGDVTPSPNIGAFKSDMRNSPLGGFSEPFLTALAANAQHESGLCAENAGDLRGDVGGNSALAIPAKSCSGKEGHYCSFGYWQMNICAEKGGGAQFLEWARKKGLLGDATDWKKVDKAELYKILIDGDLQMEFMQGKMIELFGDDVYNPHIDGMSEEETAAYMAQQVAEKWEKCAGCEEGGPQYLDRGALGLKIAEDEANEAN